MRRAAAFAPWKSALLRDDHAANTLKLCVLSFLARSCATSSLSLILRSAEPLALAHCEFTPLE
jgi:hypothetical protein